MEPLKVLARTSCPRYYHYSDNERHVAEAKDCDLCGGAGYTEDWKPLRELVAEIVNVS